MSSFYTNIINFILFPKFKYLKCYYFILILFNRKQIYIRLFFSYLLVSVYTHLSTLLFLLLWFSVCTLDSFRFMPCHNFLENAHLYVQLNVYLDAHLDVLLLLPLRETYIVFSTRPSACNATLIRAISPRTFRATKLIFFPQLTHLLKLCNKKSKLNFDQKLLFKLAFCPGQFSVTLNGRDTGIICSVSKDISIVQRQGYFFKMSNFRSF